MKPLLEALLIPPTSFVLLLTIGMLARGRWTRLGRRLALASLAALILAGMPAVSGTLLRALETGLPLTPPRGNPPQAIIVLGGEVIRSQRNPLGIRPGLLTLDRLRTAAQLHRRTSLPVLVTGGTTQPHTAPVAMVMAQSLRNDFQTPVQWVEPKARDTWENARFSAAILHRAGIQSVYVVTSAWHMKRALVAFRGTGLIVTAYPTAPAPSLDPGPYDFVPRASGWQETYYALHEWIGYAWYELR